MRANAHTMGMSAIDVVVQGPAARYPGARHRDLREARLTAGPGLHVLLGPTGVGKTTLLRVLAGQLAPLTGEVTVDGTAVVEAPLAARRRLGYVPQDIGLPHELTLHEYLTELPALDGVAAHARNAAAAAARAATAVHLDSVLHRRLRHFSGGMQRRALLAQALSRQPRVLLADEPTAGLDPEEQVAVAALLRSVAQRLRAGGYPLRAGCRRAAGTGRAPPRRPRAAARRHGRLCRPSGGAGLGSASWHRSGAGRYPAPVGRPRVTAPTGHPTPRRVGTTAATHLGGCLPIDVTSGAAGRWLERRPGLPGDLAARAAPPHPARLASP